MTVLGLVSAAQLVVNVVLFLVPLAEAVRVWRAGVLTQPLLQ